MEQVAKYLLVAHFPHHLTKLPCVQCKPKYDQVAKYTYHPDWHVIKERYVLLISHLCIAMYNGI